MAIASVRSVAGRKHMTKIKMILLGAALVTSVCVGETQSKKEHKPAPKQPSIASGQETYLKYCASCHGKDAKGDGPAAFVLRTPAPDLTTLSKRHENKYPAGYVSVVLTFGKSFARMDRRICPSGDPASKRSIRFTTQRANNTSTTSSLILDRFRRNRRVLSLTSTG
jgi:hypothetical protein